MTRKTINPGFITPTPNIPACRPPANLLPTAINTALKALDALVAKQADALVRARELQDDQAERIAVEADEAAAATALRAGNPLPDPVNATKLATDRANVAREVAGYATAIANANNDLNNQKLALTQVAGFGDGTASIRAEVTAAGATLADAFARFTASESLDRWLEGGPKYAPATDIEVLDAQPFMQRAELSNGQRYQPGADAIANLTHALTN